MKTKINLFRRRSIEPAILPPMVCWLCGNELQGRTIFPVASDLGYVDCCGRCIGVIQDRAAQVIGAPPLVSRINESLQQQKVRWRKETGCT